MIKVFVDSHATGYKMLQCKDGKKDISLALYKKLLKRYFASSENYDENEYIFLRITNFDFILS